MYQNVGYRPTLTNKLRKIMCFDAPHAAEVNFLSDPSIYFDIKYIFGTELNAESSCV
jgi:hypothetical protein